MTLDPPDEDEEEQQPSGGGRLQPTSPGAVTAWAAVGLVGGWLLRPIAERAQGTAPIVTWLQPLALFFVAAILGATAWITWRQLHVHREWVEPHRAVNRFVLARSCVLVGALVAGGYFGYALTWLGVDTELARSACGDRCTRRRRGVDRRDSAAPRASVSRQIRRRRRLT